MDYRDRLTKEHHAIALEKVNEISDDDLNGLAPLVIFERNLHLGVDSQGNRLSTDDRATLQKTIDALRVTLAKKYSNGSLALLQTRLNSFHLSDSFVQEEIIRRKT